MKKVIAQLLPEEFAKVFDIRMHEGYVTPFSTREAAGAMRNGTSVVKTRVDPGGDITSVGQRGKVMGSIRAPGVPDLGIMYFIAWDHEPTYVISCHESKLAASQ